MLLVIITRYFFTSPFLHQYLSSEIGVAFNVTVCPFAGYFKKQGVPELTAHAVCNFDYYSAREFGIDLDRLQTIVDGAAHPDFRWKLFYTQRAVRKGSTVVSNPKRTPYDKSFQWTLKSARH